MDEASKDVVATTQNKSTDEHSESDRLNTAFCNSLSSVLCESDTSNRAIQEHGHELSVAKSQCDARDANYLPSNCIPDDPTSPNASSIVSLSSISTLSSCSEHSVRIEQRHVMISDNPCHSLIEIQLIPDDKDNSECCFEPERIINRENGCKLSECSYLSESHLMRSDWQEVSQPGINSAEKNLHVLPEVEKLSNVQLRAKLIEYGESPGPVTAATRRTLELRLCSYMGGEAHVKQQSGRCLTLLSLALPLDLTVSFYLRQCADVAANFSAWTKVEGEVVAIEERQLANR